MKPKYATVAVDLKKATVDYKDSVTFSSVFVNDFFVILLCVITAHLN